MASLDQLTAAIADAGRQGSVEANVTEAFLSRMERDGKTVREYRIQPGAEVSCSAGSEDYTVVRLEADYSASDDLTLEVMMRDLETGETAPAVATWTSKACPTSATASD